MGPAGVGKTDLVKYLVNKHPQALIVTVKDISSKQNYYSTINKLLSIGNYVVADGHHVFKQDRQEMFDNINTDDVYIIGVWVENSWNNILSNNDNKPKHEQVSRKDLAYIFNYRSSPEKDEPFNDIVYLMVDAGIGMSKTQPYMTDIYGALDRI